MIHLDDYSSLWGFDYMFYFFYNSQKTDNLELYRPVVSFGRSKQLRKKENWLNDNNRHLISFWNGLTGNWLKDNGSQTKLLRDVQVSLKYLLGVVVYQDELPAQSFLNTEEKYSFLRNGRSEFCLRGISPML